MEQDYGADPVVRCMSCSELLTVPSMKKLGCCHKCGNKRVTNVRTLSEKEMDKLKAKGGFDDFISLFEEVEDYDTI